MKQLTAQPPGGQSGFTMIEVLVALAIAGVALAAIMRTMGVMTQNNGMVRDRALALLSAENRLIELDLDGVPRTVRPERFACPQGRARLVCEQSVETLKSGARRISVSVYEDGPARRQLARLDRMLEPR